MTEHSSDPRVARLTAFCKTREEMETSERAVFAPFAEKSGDSRGRKYSESSHSYRTEFQRDRARIIHSRAFRRMEYKTQVFLNGTGDHLRTRLTHSIEVASISRTIARALRLNEDLAEAIALAHDLGHAPFGHSGEEMLAECMRDHGGFDHNRQSVRVVELLETTYPSFPGLNLTFEVREGLRKHETFCHDLDDAVDFEILSAAQLAENEVWRRSEGALRARYSGARAPELHKLIIRNIIDNEVHDLVATSAKSIAESDVQNPDDVRRHPARLIRYSDELAEANRALRKFLYQNVYYHPRVSELNRRASEMLRQVFEAYLVDPDSLGDGATRRIEKEGLHRTVCDYIAGMTDRYLIEEYERVAGL